MKLKIHHIILITATLFSLIITNELFLKDPAIWPDEAAIVDGVIKQIEGKIPFSFSQYSPLTNLFWVYWIKSFGFSISVFRLLPLTFGLMFCIVFYFFLKNFHKKESAPLLSSLTMASLLADFTFLRSSRVGRPEIFALFFGVLTLLLMYWGLRGNFSAKVKYLLVIVSLVTSAAIIFIHPLAIFFSFSACLLFIIFGGFKILRSKVFYLILAVVLIALIIKLFPLLWGQLQVGLSLGKDIDNSLSSFLFNSPNWEFKIIYTLYLLITFLFIIFSVANREKHYLFLSCVLILAWIFGVFGKGMWYLVYPIPFVYLALFILFKRSFKPRFFLAIVILLVFFNLKLQFDSFVIFSGDKYSYDKFTNKILEIIPDKKTVFLSSIPDPFFAFISKGRNNLLEEFPSYNVSTEYYSKLLEKSDYVIYNGTYDSAFSGAFLFNYLKDNSSKTYEIGEPNQYKAWVIELKPKEERKIPI